MDYMPTFKMSKKPKQNLFPPPPYCRTTNRSTSQDRSAPHPVKLTVSDPSKILQLVESLTDTTSKGLEKKINRYLQMETESQLAFLISVTSNEAYYQVLGTKKLELSKRFRLDPELVNNVCSVSSTIKCGTFVEHEPEFQEILIQALDNNHASVKTIALLTPNHPSLRIIFACLVNPQKDDSFILRLVHETFRFSIPILLNTSMSEGEAKLKQECQSLLNVAKKLFLNLSDLSDLLLEIMSEARNLTDAERCSLFLAEDDYLVAKVFDGTTSELAKEFRIPKDMGIAGMVFSNGQVINIKDAYSCPMFYKKVDETTGFKTRNLLCFPIRDEEGIIGVAQLCNKREGDFTVDDEEVAIPFSVYCGLAIMHTLIYKKTYEAQIKTQLSNELMMYHMKVDEDVVLRVLNCTHSHNLRIDKLSFTPRKVSYNETPCYVLKMFEHLKLMDVFNIKRDLLTRFIMYSQKGYRNTPYHNWMHAFSVTHFAYLVIKMFRLIEKGYCTHLEALSVLTSCIGHDIDHRGTTNGFQMSTGSTLADLYSSEGSVMERHHLSQTLCILNTEKCNFLECLDNQNYRKCLDRLKNNILATDLATHMKKLPEMQQMIEDGYEKDNVDHRELLLSLIMTCSDLSDQTKGFKMAKDVATMVYEEFFFQGDLEKEMGNKPMLMMDRERASIPDLQIDFLNYICIPTFKILAALFPAAQQFVDIMDATMQCWEASKSVFVHHGNSGRSSLEVLKSTALESEVKTALSKKGLEEPDTTKTPAEEKEVNKLTDDELTKRSGEEL